MDEANEPREPAKLRILWVVSKLTWQGGVGRVIAGATKELAARGHEVHVAGPAPDGAPEPIPHVHVHPWPKRRAKIAQLPDWVRTQRSIRAQVIHFHSALPHGELILAARALRGWLGAPRLVVTPHSSRPFPKRRSRLGLRVADVVIAPSEWAASSARSAGAPAHGTYVVPGGIDPLPEPAPHGRDPLVVLFGRLVGIKHADVLLDAFDEVAVSRPTWRLVIAGEGRELEPLRARARQARCASRIHLPGAVHGDAKREILARAAIGVLASERESFGGALLEYQAHGIACIASDIGALRELAREGRAAWLVPPGDRAALAEGLGALMDDTDLRRELGRAAIEVASEHLWPAIASRYEAIYRSCFARRG